MSFQRYASIKGIGQVRVLNYAGNDRWDVLDKRDQVRREPTHRINFWKESHDNRTDKRG